MNETCVDPNDIIIEGVIQTLKEWCVKTGQRPGQLFLNSAYPTESNPELFYEEDVGKALAKIRRLVVLRQSAEYVQDAIEVYGLTWQANHKSKR